MEWAKAFSPERKIDWEDIADSIREAVSMDEAVAVYAPHIRVSHHRIPCPFHNGTDYNFSFTRYGYRCFVCGATGDVITFVKELQGLSTRVDAMKRLNLDMNLHLPIGECATAEVSAEMARRRAERERRRLARQEWEAEYDRLWDEYTRLDQIRCTADPSSDEFANAVKNIDYISYQINCLPAEPR